MLLSTGYKDPTIITSMGPVLKKNEFYIPKSKQMAYDNFNGERFCKAFWIFTINLQIFWQFNIL
jgi:hypothetical protein